eukprot:406131-Heterocapsa_arctica.AAC.1
MAIFAKMENIKIDVYSHGIPCHTYEFINRWGAQENHYDLLHPIREEVKINKTFRETFYDQIEEDKNKRNWEANDASNYISRRSKNE